MVSAKKKTIKITPESTEAFINRELSWLRFASRVLSLAEDEEVYLLERVRFAGILGMLHDEFFTKRIAGLKRQVQVSSGARKKMRQWLAQQLDLEGSDVSVIDRSLRIADLIKFRPDGANRWRHRWKSPLASTRCRTSPGEDCSSRRGCASRMGSKRSRLTSKATWRGGRDMIDLWEFHFTITLSMPWVSADEREPWSR